jgi:uncharacterized protein YkwD
MSVTRFNNGLAALRAGGRSNTGWAGSLGGLFIGSSLALAACSGGDSSDDTIEDEPNEPAPSTPAAPAMPSADDAPSSQSDNDEGGPNVTDLDESTAPSGQGDNDDGEPGADSDAEAAGMSPLPNGATLVPETDLCAAVADWDPEWVQFEEEVLRLVNEFRSQPADCGVEGQFAAAGPLTMNPILRCSARLHSLDMFERDYFDHNTPDGVDPFERMAEAGFVGSGGGENIALGQRSPEEVMVAWMESDGHCANVMRAAFDTIGVGYHPGSGARGVGSNYWTQNFGAPPFMRGGNRR